MAAETERDLGVSIFQRSFQRAGVKEREREIGEQVSTMGSKGLIWSRLPERQTLDIPVLSA